MSMTAVFDDAGPDVRTGSSCAGVGTEGLDCDPAAITEDASATCNGSCCAARSSRLSLSVDCEAATEGVAVFELDATADVLITGLGMLDFGVIAFDAVCLGGMISSEACPLTFRSW